VLTLIQVIVIKKSS